MLLSRISISIKGNRCSATTTVPSHATLPSLLALLKSYPNVSWSADAHSGVAGGSISLSDGSSSGTEVEVR